MQQKATITPDHRLPTPWGGMRWTDGQGNDQYIINQGEQCGVYLDNAIPDWVLTTSGHFYKYDGICKPTSVITDNGDTLLLPPGLIMKRMTP